LGSPLKRDTAEVVSKTLFQVPLLMGADWGEKQKANAGRFEIGRAQPKGRLLPNLRWGVRRPKGGQNLTIAGSQSCATSKNLQDGKGGLAFPICSCQGKKVGQNSRGKNREVA